MISVVIILVLSIVNIFLIYALVRASKRLLEFDDIFGYFVHDIEINVEYLTKLLETPVYSNSPEIVDANNKMTIIRDRLNEYINRMEESTARKLRKPEKKSVKPPVVV